MDTKRQKHKLLTKVENHRQRKGLSALREKLWPLSLHKGYVPTLPSRRFRLPPSKYFLQTVLGLCYSFLSWFTYVSRR